MNRGFLRNKGSSQPIDLNDPMTPITLLHDLWRSFENEVIPLAASDVQRQEMKRAFYAGAQAVLFNIEDAFAEGLPPEEAGKVLPAIGVEIQRFVDKVAATKQGKQH